MVVGFTLKLCNLTRWLHQVKNSEYKIYSVQIQTLISRLVQLQNAGLLNSSKAGVDCFDLPLK